MYYMMNPWSKSLVFFFSFSYTGLFLNLFSYNYNLCRVFLKVSYVSLTGIDLENIVYYKDDTHYFVMTAKKQSLLEKGVILRVSSHLIV